MLPDLSKGRGLAETAHVVVLARGVNVGQRSVDCRDCDDVRRCRDGELVCLVLARTVEIAPAGADVALAVTELDLDGVPTITSDSLRVSFVERSQPAK